MRCTPEERLPSGDESKTLELMCKACCRSLEGSPTLLLIQRSEIVSHPQRHGTVRNLCYSNKLLPKSDRIGYNGSYIFADTDKVGSHDKVEFYHADCLTCAHCGERLTPADGKCWKYRKCSVVCSHCRNRLTHCARCRTRVATDAWVHKFDELPFHVACLSCEQCERRLKQGDKCGLWGDRLLCLEHFLSRSLLFELRESIGPADDADCQVGRTEAKGDSSKRSNCNLLGESTEEKLQKQPKKENNTTESSHDQSSHYKTEQLIRDEKNVLPKNVDETETFPIKAKVVSKVESFTTTSEHWYSEDPIACAESVPVATPTVDCSVTGLELGGHSLDSSTSSGCSSHSKSKRIRTSFTPDQLAILQANFDIEANPDGQELERIANVARLNKRVTQVWFQNARARKKKSECKSLSPSSLTASFFGTSYCFQEYGNQLDDTADSPQASSCAAGDSSAICIHPTDVIFDPNAPLTAQLDTRDLPMVPLRLPYASATPLIDDRGFEPKSQQPSTDAIYTDTRINQLFNCVKFYNSRWQNSMVKDIVSQDESLWSPYNGNGNRFVPSFERLNSIAKLDDHTNLNKPPCLMTTYPINFIQTTPPPPRENIGFVDN